jgi:hypothetical protein
MRHDDGPAKALHGIPNGRFPALKAVQEYGIA